MSKNFENAQTAESGNSEQWESSTPNGQQTTPESTRVLPVANAIEASMTQDVMVVANQVVTNMLEILDEDAMLGVPPTPNAPTSNSDDDDDECEESRQESKIQQNPNDLDQSSSALYDDSTGQSVVRTPAPQRYRFLDSPPKFQVFPPSMFNERPTGQEEGEAVLNRSDLGNEQEIEEMEVVEQLLDGSSGNEIGHMTKSANSSNQPESSISSSMGEMKEILEISSDEGGPHSFLNRPVQPPPKFRISVAPQGLEPIQELSATTPSTPSQKSNETSDISTNIHSIAARHVVEHTDHEIHEDDYDYEEEEEVSEYSNSDQDRPRRLPHDRFRALTPDDSPEEQLERQRALQRGRPGYIDRQIPAPTSSRNIVRGPGIIIRSLRGKAQVMITEHLFEPDYKVEVIGDHGDDIILKTEGRVPRRRINIASDNSIDIYINGINIADIERKIRDRIDDEMRASMKMFNGIPVPREIYGALCRKWNMRQMSPPSQRTSGKRSATSPTPPAKRPKTAAAMNVSLSTSPAQSIPSASPTPTAVPAPPTPTAVPARPTPTAVAPQAASVVAMPPTPSTSAAIPSKRRGRPSKSSNSVVKKAVPKPAPKKVHAMKLRSDSAKIGPQRLKFAKSKKAILSIRDVKTILEEIETALNQLDFSTNVENMLRSRLSELRKLTDDYDRAPSVRKFSKITAKCDHLGTSVELHAR